MHPQTGLVIDQPLIQWPEDWEPEQLQLQVLLHATRGLLTMSSNRICGGDKYLTVHAVNIRRVVIGRLDFNIGLLGTIGLDEQGGQVLLPELTYIEHAAHERRLVSHGRFELTRESIRNYRDHLLAGFRTPVPLSFNLYPCAVCEENTLAEPRGSFEICQLCGWEDEDWFCSGELSPNHMSLEEGKKRFAERGGVWDTLPRATLEERKTRFQAELDERRYGLSYVKHLAQYLGLASIPVGDRADAADHES